MGTRIKNTTKRMVQNLSKTDSATAARGFAYQIVSYVAPIEAAKNILQGKCARHPQAWGRCAPASTSAMNQLSNDGQDLDDTSFQTGQIAGDIAVLTFAIVAFPGAGIGGPARAGNIAKTARAAKTVLASKTLATTARQTKAANSGAQVVRALPRGGATLTQRGLEHIVYRHWATSGFSGVGKFAIGTSARSLRSMIDDVARNGARRPNTGGRPGTIFERDLGRIIGTNGSGTSTSRLRVVVAPDGHVVTAFPI